MADRTRAFLNVLESLGMAARFRRGRRLHRTGAVRGLTITTSVATANVREADDTCRVRIAVHAFSAAQWHRVRQALAAQAIHVAKLLAGEVPEELDDLFTGLDLSLLPQSVGEVALSCSCQDWQEPCTHVIATWYALADEFDRDPFAMFAWRGRARLELLDELHEPRSAAPEGAGSSAGRSFWTAGRRTPPPAPPVGTRRSDAVLDQLDPLPLTLGRHDVTDLIRPVYEHVARASQPPESTVDA